MLANKYDYSKLFENIINNEYFSMPRCACVQCNSCTCACSCRAFPERENIKW